MIQPIVDLVVYKTLYHSPWQQQHFVQEDWHTTLIPHMTLQQLDYPETNKDFC
jgi:hypothetical protein